MGATQGSPTANTAFTRSADLADAATRTPYRRSAQRPLSGTFRSVVPHRPTSNAATNRETAARCSGSLNQMSMAGPQTTTQWRRHVTRGASASTNANVVPRSSARHRRRRRLRAPGGSRVVRPFRQARQYVVEDLLEPGALVRDGSAVTLNLLSINAR